MLYCLSSSSISLNFKTKIVTDLNLRGFIEQIAFSLFLIVDSVSLSCSSGVKELKNPTLQLRSRPL